MKLRLLALAPAFALLTGMAACPDPNRPADRGAPEAKAPEGTQAAAAGDETVVAKIGQDEITLAELDASIGSELYELRSQALERMVAEELLEAEAKRRGLSGPEELVQKEVEEAVPPPTDEEIRKFYEQQGLQARGMPYESVKPRLEQMVSRQKKAERFQALLDDLKKKQNVSTDLPRPRVEVAAVGPAKGPENAPVTIVEFSEFQCPFCSRVLPTIEQVKETYGDKVRIVFRNFPLPFHDKAQKAAEAGECAAEQDKFWPYHDVLFANQKELGEEKLVEYAGQVEGLDTAKLKECLDSGRMAAEVTKDMEAGKKAGVSGTPAFFINGIMVSGALPFEEFKKIIDSELQRAS